MLGSIIEHDGLDEFIQVPFGHASGLDFDTETACAFKARWAEKSGFGEVLIGVVLDSLGLSAFATVDEIAGGFCSIQRGDFAGFSVIAFFLALGDGVVGELLARCGVDLPAVAEAGMRSFANRRQVRRVGRLHDGLDG